MYVINNVLLNYVQFRDSYGTTGKENTNKFAFNLAVNNFAYIKF